MASSSWISTKGNWASTEESNLDPGTNVVNSDCDANPSTSEADTITTIPGVPQIQGEVEESEESNYVGKKAVIKTFYEGPSSNSNSCRCCINWVEQRPAQLPEATAKTYNEAAIRVYKTKDHSANTFSYLTPLMFHSIEIQSPFILAAIKEILEEYHTFLSDNQIAKFQAPFHTLYFAHSKIVQLLQQSSIVGETRTHLEMLTKLMDDMFNNTSEVVSGLLEKKLIRFDLLWTIFPKGIMVYSHINEHDRLYEVISCTFLSGTFQDRTPKWCIACRYVQFDGTEFGFSKTNFLIDSFVGNEKISNLLVYPLGFHENCDLKTKLIERGKSLLEFQGMSFHEYSGIGVDVENKKKYSVSGRIIVDTLAYSKHNPDLIWKVEPLQDQNSSLNVQTDKTHRILDLGHYMSPESSPYNEETTPATKKRPNADIIERNKKTLWDNQGYLLLLSPTLAGFSLEWKKWLLFDIDGIRPVAWNEEAYDHLVYSDEYKDLILSFVESREKCNIEIDDVIIGKAYAIGQGLILLLSGPPGTGKTLTAEAIADKTRRPLYHLQAEELGTDASSLGANLAEVLKLAAEWKAIILLDEADVFLAKRSPDNVLRNELVSIFLRELEYFQGIMFLTTNLLSTIDDAFESRIHIHLLFESLSFDSRTKIWKKFLQRLPSDNTNTTSFVEIGEEDLEQLAAWELNGRQIKNALKSTRTWCLCRGLKITLKRLERGINVTAPRAKKALQSQTEK